MANFQKPTIAFEKAWQEFFSDLTEHQKALFTSSDSPTALLDEVTNSHGSYVNSSTSIRAVVKIKPAIDGLLRFARAFDVISNVYPEVLGLLWGGLRIVLHLAKSYAEFFENIAECIQTIGTSLSRIKIVEGIFPSSDTLRMSLEELYMQILQFCYDAKKVFRDFGEKKKRGLISNRLKIFSQGLWSSFSAQFEQTKEDLEKLIDRIDKEAVVAGLEAAKASQEEQRQQWSIQAIENEEARQHREANRAHIEAQKVEVEKQSKWRQVEAILWQEQRDFHSAANDFIADATLLGTCQWLAPADAELNHELAYKAHYPGTCSWILHEPEFTRWVEGENAILWVHAIPGAGKTVLSASVIECIRSTLGPSDGLAYYYFDYKHRDQQSIRALLASLVASLITKYPRFYAAVASKLSKARTAGKAPATSILRSLLLDATAHFHTLYIVVDALDECEDHDDLFQQFFNIPSCSQGDVRMFSTSRNNPDIRESFADVPHLYIEMRESVVEQDIRVFVRAEITHIIAKQKIKIRNPELKNEIINTLSEKADGMFQWVRCQIDQLQKLKTDKAIRNSLTKLPKGLDATYSRLLENLQAQHEEEDIASIQRLLRWLTHAVRPLRVRELAEAIAIEPGQRVFDEDAVLTDPMDLLRYGEGLIVLKKGRVHLSHFSVREFLVSTAVQERTPDFYMGTLESNADLAATCLTYLNLNNFTHATISEVDLTTASDANTSSTDNDVSANGTSPSERGIPSHFLSYASCEWPVHYQRVADYDWRPKELVSSLLRMPSSNNFAIMRDVSSKHKADLTGCSPLQYCAAIGLMEQLQLLLDQGLDINDLAGRQGTPLNFAVKFDHADLVSYLVDGMGADPKISSVSPNGHRSNALHWALDEDHVSTVSENIVFLILDSVNGSNLNEVGGNLQPQRPIHYATRGGRLDLVKLLIQFGAEFDAPDFDGKTPLAIAVEEDHIEMASYLLEQGAIFKDADECDSIRESPFGIDAIMPNVSGPLWDVMTTLRSQAENSTTSAYWGFALSATAREGKLDPLKQLLSTNIESHVANTGKMLAGTPTDKLNAEKMSSRDIEARVGPIFSALTPAVQSNNAEVVLVLLNSLLQVIATLQKGAVPHMGADIHLTIIHDIRDSGFCKLPWYHSSLYLSILAGYLRSAQLAAHGIIASDASRERSVKLDPLRMIKFGWPRQGLDSVAVPTNLPDPQEAGSGFRRTLSLEGDSSLLTAVAATTIQEFCERARILWHGKRNTRKSLNLYLLSLQPFATKAQIVEYLLRNGADANFLDRAARTPLFWATQFTKVDSTLHDVCTILEKMGGLLYIADDVVVSHLRTSIIEELKEKSMAGDGLSVSAIDLTLKSDWNLLGRLLYWAGDFDRATVAFEISSVYDSSLTSNPPVYHYFFCDVCTPGDYRNETLIRGYRHIVRDSLGRDLCSLCHEEAQVDAFRVPSRAWVSRQQRIEEDMGNEFDRLKTLHANDAVALENAKKKYKRELLISKRDQMLQWLRVAAEDFGTRDIASLVAMYRREHLQGADQVEN